MKSAGSIQSTIQVLRNCISTQPRGPWELVFKNKERWTCTANTPISYDVKRHMVQQWKAPRSREKAERPVREITQINVPLILHGKRTWLAAIPTSRKRIGD